MPVNIDIGEMDKKVVFHKNIPTVKGAGYQDAYYVLYTGWGALKKRSGVRVNQFGEIVNENTYELFVWYRTSLESNLRSDLKIIVDGRSFTPQTWNKVEEKNFNYYFIITENPAMSQETEGAAVLVEEPLYLETEPGETSVQSDLLINVNIYAVGRSGTIYNRTEGTPGNFQFKYVAGSGTIEFGTLFNAGEIIYILYKS